MNSITLLYFGDLMARVHIGRETLRLPTAVQDVGGLMKLLAMRGGDWAASFAEPRATLRITVNKRDADATTPLHAGDEIAFIEFATL